jgi:ketosteroid isomerase-like protein
MTGEVDAVTAAYETFLRCDLDAAVATLADDVVWTEPLEFPNGGRPFGGRIVAVHSVSGRRADGPGGVAASAD